MPDQPAIPASDINSSPLPTSCGRALVLGGGSLKGAFQCGAIMAILESGFQPEALYGISVGSLNATYLAYEANRQHAINGRIDWPKAGRALLEFWIRSITRPEDVAVIRPRLLTGYNTLMSRFDGFLDNAPLRRLIRSHVDTEVLKQGPIKLKVGAVNVIEGDMVYVDPGDEHFLDYVFASSSLPFLMPAVPIGGDHRKAFLDGGLREVAPLREAISDGATAIMCVACHAKHIFNEAFNYRNLLSLVERVKDITVNQIVNNDIAWAERFGEREISRGHPFSMTVVRPTEPLYLNLQKFTSADISKLIVQGYKAGTDGLRTHEKS